MSHFTKMKICCSDRRLIEQIAKKFGWRLETYSKFVNLYSKETVENALVLQDERNKVKLAFDELGYPVIDSYYMGTEYEKFLHEYATESLKRQAMLSGYSVQDLGVNAEGTRIIEIEVFE